MYKVQYICVDDLVKRKFCDFWMKSKAENYRNLKEVKKKTKLNGKMKKESFGYSYTDGKNYYVIERM